MQSGGTTDNKLARRQAALAAAKRAAGPVYYEPYHNPSKRHGQYLTSDPSPRLSNQHRIIHIDNRDPEMLDRWEDEWRGEKYLQGFRPSKRKSVK